MSNPISFPSARQPATEKDGQGNEVFTRSWSIFFQQVYERIGSVSALNNNELAGMLENDLPAAAATDLTAQEGVRMAEELRNELSAARADIDSLRRMMGDMSGQLQPPDADLRRRVQEIEDRLS